MLAYSDVKSQSADIKMLAGLIIQYNQSQRHWKRHGSSVTAYAVFQLKLKIKLLVLYSIQEISIVYYLK